MVMNKTLIMLFLLFALPAAGQTFRNDGKINISGGYLVINGNYQNEASGSVTLDGIITVSGNWTNNGSGNIIETPGTNGEVIFNGTTQTIGGTSNIYNFEKLTISSGSTTQVEAGKGVTAYGACTFTSPLVLKSTTTPFRPLMATFINESTVSGNITMELPYTSTGNATASTGRSLYFSSPISNATSTIFDVASGTNLLWYQNELTRMYVKVTANDAPLTNAKGYILRSATTQLFSFTGPPNNESSYTKNNIPRAITTQKYLLGNPYPAVINWASMSKTNLTNTVWYRSCTTSGGMLVDTYNATSGVGTANNGTAAVDGNIPPMQSFWIEVTTVGQTGDVTIHNTDRTHNWGTSNFLKSQAQQNKNIFRLYLYSNDNRDEAVIIQANEAQDNFEAWDSKKLFLNEPNVAEIYTISPERYSLVIQAVKPISQPDTILIGLNIGTSGTYKFVGNFNESAGQQNIYLEDKLKNVKQDLNLYPEYTFTSGVVKDTLGSRFALLFLPKPRLTTKSTLTACAPETVNLATSITEGTDNGLTYTFWKDEKATIAYTTPNTAESGTYYIMGTATNGSYTISEPIEVVINSLPTVAVNTPTSVCSPNTVDITSSAITVGSDPDLIFTYWTDKEATVAYNTPTAATSGTYYIKGVAATGCSSLPSPIEVIINPTPTLITNNPAAIIPPATADITASEITLGSTSGLTYTYWLDAIATLPFITPKSAEAGNYYIKGIDDYTGCYSIAGPVIVTANTTGIPTDEIDRINIYSYNKQIHIDNCKPNSQIHIIDMSGRQVYIGISTTNNETISSNLKTGLYIVKIVSNQIVKSQKILLQ